MAQLCARRRASKQKKDDSRETKVLVNATRTYSPIFENQYSNLHVLQCMICSVEVERYKKVIPPVDDISAVLSRALRKPASSLPNVHCRWTFGARLTITTFLVMQEKCPVMLTYPLGVVIVEDQLTWGYVRQTVLLQGKLPGDWCGRFRGRLLLISRSFRFLARLKTFSGGLLKILLFVLSSRTIRKFLEMISQPQGYWGERW